MIDALPLGKIDWQHAPLDPALGDIKDGIEHSPHTQGARSSTTFGGGDQIFDPLQFLVGQVAWVYCFVHNPMLHNPRRLFRQALKTYALQVVHGRLFSMVQRTAKQWIHVLLPALLAALRTLGDAPARSRPALAQRLGVPEADIATMVTPLEEKAAPVATVPAAAPAAPLVPMTGPHGAS